MLKQQQFPFLPHFKKLKPHLLSAEHIFQTLNPEKSSPPKSSAFQKRKKSKQEGGKRKYPRGMGSGRESDTK
jgi:hypothetical protein